MQGYLLGQLQGISEGFGDELLIDGLAYKRHELGTGQYHSLCGPLAVERYTYRQMGMRNGPTTVPLELVAGLVEGATPALACNVAHGYAQHDMRLHGEVLLLAHRQPPSRATLKRIAKDIGTAAVQAVPRIEPMLRRAETAPQGTVALWCPEIRHAAIFARFAARQQIGSSASPGYFWSRPDASGHRSVHRRHACLRPQRAHGPKA